MNLVTNSLLMVSGVSIAIGLVHLKLCFQPHRLKANILFVFTAFGLAGFALLERARMQTGITAEFIELARWTQIPVWFLIVGIAWFMHVFTQAGRPWLLWSVTILRTLALIANFASTTNLTYRQVTSMESTTFLGESLYVATGVSSPWAILGQLSLVLLAVYALDAAIELWRRDDRRQALAVCGSIFFFAGSAAVYASAVNWEVANVPLFISPFFLGVIAAIGNELTLEVQRAGQLAHDLATRDAELIETERRLDTSADAAAVGIWTRTMPGDRFWASNKCYELYGFSNARPMTYLDVMARVHSSDRDDLQKAVRNAIVNGIPYDIEFRISMPDRSTRWIASRCAVETRNGKPTMLRGADIDVTDRRLAQEARNNLAAIVESSDDAILSKTLDGIITSWNAGATKMYGYTSEEMIGQHVSVLAPDDRKSEIAEILGRVRNSEPIDHLETVRVRRNGERIYVSLTVSPVRGPHGSVIGASAIERDITNQRRAAEALKESESLFRNMADTAPIMIWIAGPDRRCSFVNEGWLRFTGRRIEEEIGSGWADGLHNDDSDATLATYNAAFDAREPFQMEFRYRRAGGQYRWIYDVGTPRFSSEGDFLGYIGSCVDVTETKVAMEALRELSGKFIGAQEKERARLARELHDDLSQSLALLSIQLEVLGRDPQNSAPLKRKIAKLTSQIKVLSSDVHRISHDLHPAMLAKVGLESALSLFCREYSASHDIKVEFEANVPRTLPNDVSLCLYRIAQESLQNIFKHSGASTARVGLDMEGSKIRLRVSDNGDGFDPEASNSKDSLGLVSMRERVRALNGRITIDSSIGAGTLITVELPLPRE